MLIIILSQYLFYYDYRYVIRYHIALSMIIYNEFYKNVFFLRALMLSIVT